MNDPQIQPKKTCIAYIDGFNWYHGIFQHRPEWKWLNIQPFIEALCPRENVLEIKFFTAYVNPNRHLCEKRNRQTSYLTALRKQSTKLKIILGKFQAKKVTCKVEKCEFDCDKDYYVPGEKQTDVNIAVNLIDDALNNRSDVIILISGDADLEPAVKWVRDNRPNIKILVYVPTLSKEELRPEAEYKPRRNDYYNSISVETKELPLDGIPHHQMPDPVVISEARKIYKPTTWEARK